MAKKYKFVSYAELGMDVNQQGVPIEAEKGEVYRSPSGITLPIGGNKHEHGGTKFIAEENSEIFSNHLKPARVKGGKQFIKEHFGSAPSKATFADIAKRYDTRKEFEKLEKGGFDEITRSSLLHNIEAKNKKLDTLFAFQQVVNGNHSSGMMQKGGPAKKQTAQKQTAQKERSWWDKYLNDEDSTFQNILEFADPTGISSWDDVYRAIKNPNVSKSEAALEVLGALPGAGFLRFGKAALKLGPKIAKWAGKKMPDLFKSADEILEAAVKQSKNPATEAAKKAKTKPPVTAKRIKEKYVEARKNLDNYVPDNSPVDYNKADALFDRTQALKKMYKKRRSFENTDKGLGLVNVFFRPGAGVINESAVKKDDAMPAATVDGNLSDAELKKELEANAKKVNTPTNTVPNTKKINNTVNVQSKTFQKEEKNYNIVYPDGRKVKVYTDGSEEPIEILGDPEEFEYGGFVYAEDGVKSTYRKAAIFNNDKKLSSKYQKKSPKAQKDTYEKYYNMPEAELQQIVNSGGKGAIAAGMALAYQKATKNKQETFEYYNPVTKQTGLYRSGFINNKKDVTPLPSIPIQGFTTPGAQPIIQPSALPTPTTIKATNITPKTPINKPFKNELGFWDYAPLINANLAPKTTNYLGQTQVYDMMYNPVSLRSAKNDAAGLARVMGDNRFLSPSVSASRNASTMGNLLQENSRLTENENNMNSQLLTSVNQFNIQNRQGQQNLQQQFNKQFVDENNADLAARMQNQDLRMREFGNAVKANRMQNRIINLWDSNAMQNMDFTMDANGNIQVSRNKTPIDLSATGTQPFFNYDVIQSQYADEEKERKQKNKVKRKNPDGSESTTEVTEASKTKKGAKINKRKKGTYVW